jgi:hypothetical protein
MSRNGGEAKSPEETVRGDTTKKPGPGTDAEFIDTAPPGNPAGYPVEKGDPGSEGY